MKIFLIPAELYDGVTTPIPAYVQAAVAACTVFFVENERTTRRYLKRLWPAMVIDNYTWVPIHKAEADTLQQLAAFLKKGATIGIISEAGCPGIADPGQLLVAKAQEMGAEVKPLVGPSSILLALMASGLNGQQFCFHGYLPIEAGLRKKKLLQLENHCYEAGATQLFIETPYRNDAMLREILQSCRPTTLLTIAVDITAPTEYIKTLPVKAWKAASLPALHKRPALFLMGKPA